MCSILFFFKVFEDYPIVISENRDILLKTYADLNILNWRQVVDMPPRIFSHIPKKAIENEMTSFVEPMKYICPYDFSMGSWIGINEKGVIIALTNGMGSKGPHNGESSRGKILIQCLHKHARDAKQAKIMIEDILRNNDYDFVNFVVADTISAFWIRFSENGIKSGEFKPGVHHFTNYNGNEPPEHEIAKYSHMDSGKRTSSLKKLIEEIEISPSLGYEKILKQIRRIKTNHLGDSPIERQLSICKHALDNQINRPNTTSNTVIMRAKRLNRSRLYYTKSNPCENRQKNYTDLIRSLF